MPEQQRGLAARSRGPPNHGHQPAAFSRFMRILLREAEAAVRQADWWLNSAIEDD